MKKNITFLYSFLLCSGLNTNDDLKQTMLFYFNFEELILLPIHWINDYHPINECRQLHKNNLLTYFGLKR